MQVEGTKGRLGSGPAMRVMALDWGERRIGIAVSDELGISVQGLPTLNRTNIRRDLNTLTELIRQRRVASVVVGKPLHLDGSESRSSGLAARFARRLAKHAKVDTCMWDERLTSWEARNRAGSSRAKPGEADKIAAELLLESFLEAHRR